MVLATVSVEAVALAWVVSAEVALALAVSVVVVELAGEVSAEASVPVEEAVVSVDADSVVLVEVVAVMASVEVVVASAVERGWRNLPGQRHRFVPTRHDRPLRWQSLLTRSGQPRSYC